MSTDEQIRTLTNPNSELHTHVLTLERRLTSVANDEDPPAYQDAPPSEVALRIDGLHREVSQLRGCVEHDYAEKTALIAKLAQTEQDRDHWKNLYMSLNPGGNTQNFQAGSQSMHNVNNIHHAFTINMAPSPPPAESDPSRVDNVKRPKYSDACRRDVMNLPCRRAHCECWHRDQGARYAPIRPTLPANRPAKQNARH